MTATTPVPAGLLDHAAPADFTAGSRASPARRSEVIFTRAWRPLAAICALQAGLSLSLVWSNTAFGDEAWYLWLGRLAIGHWLHGAPWPTQEEHISGSAFIYPPLGAAVSYLGGLAAARILSLAFMVAATVLLYLAASRLIGRSGALCAAVIWALSEPVMRGAFATFDPMSVFLTTLSGYLVVQAGGVRLDRPKRLLLVLAAGLALAIANATAYSGLVIDPAVIAFAFLVWQLDASPLRAARDAALFGGVLAAGFPLALIVAHSTAGVSSIFRRSHSDHQSLLLVAGDVWKFSGLVIVLAIIGGGVALLNEDRRRAMLLAFLGCSILVVPAAQFYFQTGWALDKHLAYGIWFAAIAAGYGCTALLGWLPGAGKRLVVACGVLALTFPAVSNWQLAWGQFHTWADGSSFIAAFRQAAAGTNGLIFASGQQHAAEYYTPQGDRWHVWSAAGLSLHPTFPRASWPRYYATTLNSGTYSVIAVFYHTTFSATPSLSGNLLLKSHVARRYQKLVALVGSNSGQPGLPVLTLALEKNKQYELVGVGPFNITNLSGSRDYGVYAIWKLNPAGKK